MSALLTLAVAVTITGVHDGDTVRAGPERIRLIAIDAPELRGSPQCRSAKRVRNNCDHAAGLRSRDALRAMLASGPVTIQREGQDTYGRTLARLYAGGADVNCRMVRGGFAVERWGRACP